MKKLWSLIILVILALTSSSLPASATNATFISFAVPTSFNNLKILWNSNTTFTTSADALIVNNSTPSSVLLTSVSQQCNSATSGAGGLDTGSLAASTWYYNYVIYGTSGAACLVSLSNTSPTLPTGYTYYARTGTVYSDASKHFIGFTQYNRHWQYQVGSNLSGLPSLFSGAEGSITTPTYQSITAQIPATASVIYALLYNITSTGGGILMAPNSNYGAYTSTSNPAPCNVTGGSFGTEVAQVMCSIQLETAQTVYVASQTNSAAFVIGFDDNL